MFQKGRPEQDIKYKDEVLKIYPSAKWVLITQGSFKMGAIWVNDKRISEAYKVAFKAWESAYYTIKNNSLKDLYKY